MTHVKGVYLIVLINLKNKPGMCIYYLIVVKKVTYLRILIAKITCCAFLAVFANVTKIINRRK